MFGGFALPDLELRAAREAAQILHRHLAGDPGLVSVQAQRNNLGRTGMDAKPVILVTFRGAPQIRVPQFFRSYRVVKRQVQAHRIRPPRHPLGPW